MNGRIEPRIGRGDDAADPRPPQPDETLDYRPRRPGRTAHRRRQREPRARGGAGAWWVFGIALLFGLGVCLYLWREPIGERLFPEPRQNQLMAEGDAALADGRLSTADGRGARELYTAVLALQPDHAGAREGLRRVGAAALARAREALARGEHDAARDALALARSLALPAAELRPLEDELRRSEGGSEATARQVTAARSAQRAGNLDGGGDSALALYDKALQGDAGNSVATAGRSAVLADLLHRATRQLEAGELAAARELVDRVIEADPAHVDLPPVRARLAEAEQARARQTETYFRAADAALAAGQLDRARAGYENARDAGGEAQRVRRGLERVAAAYALRAERAAEDFQFAVAEAELAAARELAPDIPQLRTAEQRVLRSRARSEGGALAVERGEGDLERLLEDARRALARGDLVDPPGDSAWDKLRAARGIAPDDPRVEEAMARLEPAAVRCYEEALAANSLGRASGCLDALAALNAADGRLPAWRGRLAARYLAVADERLGAGELAAARRAVDAARELDPGSVALPAMYARLEQAGAIQN
ncbi:hypothetical protein [Coralloluteibacterium thermophilus]|uniref:Tetratricopeptide repeat protein n=1 Tax=Coralloluteibacterium thermophilum TaxID=2707049 RepID=A0ABV9NKD1_9GAMM